MRTSLLSPRLIKSVTGLTATEFDELALAFGRSWHVAEKSRRVLRTGERRKRALGAGRSATLRTAREKLLFVLFWFKVYPTFDVMEMVFGMNHSRCCRWAHRLTPILEAALGRKKHLPERKAHGLGKMFAEFPALTFIVDGTDRPCCRPKHGMTRKARYSGRKKRYSTKNIIAVRDKRIVLLGKTRPGRWHDKRCIDFEKWRFPRGSTVLGDRGFAGYTQPHAMVKTPERRPNGSKRRNRPFNKRLAKHRVVVEHAIAGVKRSRLCADIQRSRLEHLSDKIMLVGCALHNFRTESRRAA